MKSIKRLPFIIGCIALCNSAFADQLELTSNIVYGTASDFKGVGQDKLSLKQVQVKINKGDWRDVPMTYNRAPISLNNNDQYAIRVQAVDGAWVSHPSTQI